MRTVPVLAVTGALVAALLSGCSGVQASTGCVVDSGSASDLVTSIGRAGTEKAARFPTPLHPQSTQRTVVSEGTGTEIAAGDVVGYGMTIYDAQSGDVIAALPADYGTASASGVQVSNGQTTFALKGLGSALRCTRLGSTVAVTLTARDLGSLAQSKDAAWVVVMRPTRALPGSATGTPKSGEPGFPGVVSLPDGRPGTTATDPNSAALTRIRTEEVRSGTGATVRRGDLLFAEYLGVSYPANDEIANSWSESALTVVTADSQQSQKDIPGPVAAELVGRKVGSRVVVLVPAKQGGQTTGGDAAYVIDILGIARRG